MPNWVYNNMTVMGEQDRVDEFIADMSKPIPTFKSKPDDKFGHVDGEWEMYDDIVFSFWNVVAPTDFEQYFSGQNWYNWNISFWGTKWDARIEERSIEQLDKSELAGGQYQVTYHFDTAWSAPYEVFTALAEKYPHLEFQIEWEEEQGFGAELMGQDGELSTVREWQIPDSHADYVERGKSDECVCRWGSDDSEWFNDCPREEDESKTIEENSLERLTNVVTT